MKYEHAYTTWFPVISNDENGLDVTGADIRASIMNFLDEYSDEEILELVGDPAGTHVIEGS